MARAAASQMKRGVGKSPCPTHMPITSGTSKPMRQTSTICDTSSAAISGRMFSLVFGEDILASLSGCARGTRGPAQREHIADQDQGDPDDRFGLRMIILEPRAQGERQDREQDRGISGAGRADAPGEGERA